MAWVKTKIPTETKQPAIKAKDTKNIDGQKKQTTNQIQNKAISPKATTFVGKVFIYCLLLHINWF